jgi:hypothetical protein
MSLQILVVFNQSVSRLLFNRFCRGFGGQRNRWHASATIIAGHRVAPPIKFMPYAYDHYTICPGAYRSGQRGRFTQEVISIPTKLMHTGLRSVNE